MDSARIFLDGGYNDWDGYVDNGVSNRGWGHCCRSMLEGVVEVVRAIFRGIVACFRYIFSYINEVRRPNPEADPVAVGVVKGPNFLEIPEPIDWTDPANPLFNLDYITDLCRTDRQHPDWKHAGAYANIIKLLFTQLLEERPNTRSLSPENQAQLKLRVLAIMNSLNSLRDVDPDRFQNRMESTFERMHEALTHCMNNINPTFENILIDVRAASSTGAMDVRVKVLLQSYRQACLQQAVHNVLARYGSEHYMTHEAASMTYYLKRLYRKAGLSEPTSLHDDNYQLTMALPFWGWPVMAEFNRLYTVSSVIDYVHLNMGTHDNLARAPFSVWVGQSSRVVDVADDAVDFTPQVRDDSGNAVSMLTAGGSRFQKFLIRDYLIECGILQNQQPRRWCC